MAALTIPYDPQNDVHVDLKKAYAKAYLKFNDTTKAAMAVCSPGMALQVADKWLTDPVVVDEIEKLIAEKGPQAFLPTKEQILVDMKARADKASDTEYARIMDLYCRIRDFVPKPGAAPTAQVAVSVLVVPSQGSDAEWEKRAGRSQFRLIDGAASSD